LDHTAQIKLEIYNMLGQKLNTLIDEIKPAGDFQIQWNGNDETGDDVASGLYMYRLEFDDFSQTNKMLLLK
jgi:flagellar hook assembly protein FlgD